MEGFNGSKLVVCPWKFLDETCSKIPTISTTSSSVSKTVNDKKHDEGTKAKSFSQVVGMEDKREHFLEK
ncbi:hypothetical protein FRX31_014363, partial [Thalictrum thalictroides]